MNVASHAQVSVTLCYRWAVGPASCSGWSDWATGSWDHNPPVLPLGKGCQLHMRAGSHRSSLMANLVMGRPCFMPPYFQGC